MEGRSYKYKVCLQWNKDSNEFLAEAPELETCIARAGTQKEVIDLMNENIERHLSLLEEQHLPVPVPFAEKNFSGQILVRIDPTFHRDIALQANIEGISMAQFIERRLRAK